MKGCLGWTAAIIGWFIIWGTCLSFAGAWGISPFLLLLIGVAALLVIAIIVIRLLVIRDERKQAKKDKLLNIIYETISKPYNLAFSEYINKHKISQPYKDEDITKILAVDGAHWLERNSELQAEFQAKKKNRAEFYEIKSSFPNGFSYWSDNNPDAFIDCVVSHRSEIEAYETNYLESIERTDWEQRQLAYSEECIETAKELELGFGRYSYEIPFNKIDISGIETPGTFAVWNFFQKEFCTSTDLNFSTRPHIKQNSEIIKSYEDSSITIIQELYQLKFYNFIFSFFAFDDSFDVNIVINNKNHVSESEKAKYAENFSYILDSFKKDKTLSHRVNILFASDLEDSWGTNDILCSQWLSKNTIILDIASSISDVLTLSKKIISLSHKIKTTILYLSYYKAYSKDEMMRIIENDRIRIENERKEELARLAAYTVFNSTPLNWETLKNGVPFNYLFYYYPVSGSVNNDTAWHHRNIVWDFKNDPDKVEPADNLEAINFVIDGITNVLSETFQPSNLRYLTLVCIPASTKRKTESRYKHFSDLFCKKLGCINSYNHISVIKDKETRRSGGTSLDLDKIKFDEHFFKDKYVLLFDDIITRGDSMCIMSDKLRSLGAHVVCAFSIGKTKHIDI